MTVQHHSTDGGHQRILDALAKGPLHRMVLVERVGLCLNTVRNTLTELRWEGLVENVSRGVWGLK